MKDQTDVVHESDVVAKVRDLFETTLSKPPPSNNIDLWKDHQIIREQLKEISALQSRLSAQPTVSGNERSAEQWDSFMAWAKKVGIKMNGVRIGENEQGMGLVTERDVAAEEAVVNVPRHCMMTSDEARRSNMLRRAFERDMLLQSMDNVGLALFLCVHRLKPDSRYKDYIDILPTQFSTPLFFSDEELECLRPSPVYQESLLFLRTIARQFTYFFTSVAAGFDKEPKKGNQREPLFSNTPFTVANFTFELYRWAVGCVSTRVNLIPSELLKTPNGQAKMIPALIPVLDMANHDATESDEPSALIEFCDDESAAQIVSLKPLSSDKPFYIFYGKRTNAEHLLHNGFVPVAANSHDIYKLQLALPRNDKYYEKKMELLKDIGFPSGLNKSNIYLFDITSGEEPFPDALDAFVRVFIADPPSAETIDDENSKRKALEFLRNRFLLLEKTYENRKASTATSPIRDSIARLQAGELAIVHNARCNLDRRLQ